MKRLVFGVVLVAAMAASGVAIAQSAATAAPRVVGDRPVAVAAPAVRVMALGDSITGSPGCWRASLWNRLRSAGHTNVDFVGTLTAQSCGVPYDGDNEGHGGYLATQIANQNLLPAWLSATRPDVVMMHLGTNDVWSNLAPSTILAAFGKLVDQMRASNPQTKVLVAKIIPMNPSNCAQCGQRVVNLNNAIPAWAGAKSTAQSPVTVVDQWSGFSTSADTYDGVHPDDSGNQKIADRWFPVLTPLLGGPSGGSLLHGFESGTESWTGTNVTGGPWRVTEWAAQGSGSLKANVALGAGRQFGLARVGAVNLASGSTLRVTVRVPAWGSPGTGTTAKLYVKTGSAWRWYDSGASLVDSGASGTTLTLSLAGVSNRDDVREIGVQFLAASNSSGASAVYLDNVLTQ